MLPFRLSLYLAVLLLSYGHAFSATIYARADGNWNSGLTWSYLGRSGISCGCIPGSGDDVIIYTREVSVTNGNAQANSILISNAQAGGDFDFIIENGNSLTVGSNISIVANNNNDDISIILQDNNSSLTVGGNLTVSMTDGENVFLEMTESSSIQVNGNLSATMSGTSSSNLEFNLDCDSGSDHFHINGNFYIYKNGARDLVINLTNEADLYVGGSFLIDWDNTESNGDQIYINLEDNSSITSVGTTDINMNETGNTSCDVIVDLNDNARWECGVDNGNLSESFTINIQNGRNTEIYMDADAQLIVYGSTNLLHNGTGNLIFYVNTSQSGVNDCQIEVDGDLTITKSNGEKAEFFVYEDATVTIGGDFDYTSSLFLNSGRDLRLELLDNATMDIDGSMLMQLDSQGDTGNDLQLIIDNTADLIVGKDSRDLSESCQLIVSEGTLFQLEMDRDATFTIYRNLNMTHSGQDDMFVRLDKNANGSGSDAQLYVYGNLLIDKSNGNEFKMDINQDSDVTIEGDLNISITGIATAGENIEIELDNFAGLAINGNFDYLMNVPGNTTSDLMLDLNNSSTLSVGNSSYPTSSYFQADFFTGDIGDFSISDDSQVNIYGDLYLNKKGGNNFNFETSDDVNTHIYGNLQLNNIEDQDLLSFTLQNSSIVDIDGDIDLTSAVSASKVSVILNSTSYMYLGGDVLRNSSPSQFGTFDCNSSSTLELDGTEAQIIAEDYGDGADFVDYQNVVLNNSSSSSPQFTQGGIVTINNNLDFQDGILENNSSDFIIIIDNATVSNASDSSHVYGYVEKEGNDDFTFPVGSIDYYRPIGFTISSGASSADELMASYFDADPDGLHSDTLLTNTLDHLSSCEYWDLQLLNGTPSIVVQLSFREYDAGTNCSGVEEPMDLRVSHWNGSLWEDLGNGGTTGTSSSGTISASVPSSTFSPFTLASSSSANPLPVELLSFVANLNNDNEVVIEWLTASEINNAYFILEKSFDGKNWMFFEKVIGQGTKTTPTFYRTIDTKPGRGQIYYRLTQFDLNGDQETFTPKGIRINQADLAPMLVYPNPSKGYFYVLTAEDQQENIHLYNLSGQDISTQIRYEQIEKGTWKLSFDSLPAGSYLMKIGEQTELIQLLN